MAGEVKAVRERIVSVLNSVSAIAGRVSDSRVYPYPSDATFPAVNVVVAEEHYELEEAGNQQRTFEVGLDVQVEIYVKRISGYARQMDDIKDSIWDALANDSGLKTVVGKSFTIYPVRVKNIFEGDTDTPVAFSEMAFHVGFLVTEPYRTS